jgi:hypothetical protein
MSYEGYEQLLCKNGHEFENHDIYNYNCNDPFSHKCSICDVEVVWWNAVDTTNGSYDIDENGNVDISKRIDGFVDLQLLKETEVCTCACGNCHIKTVATFKLPSPEVGHHRPENYTPRYFEP